jgi:glutamate formiminotransferase
MPMLRAMFDLTAAGMFAQTKFRAFMINFNVNMVSQDTNIGHRTVLFIWRCRFETVKKF